MDIRSHIGLSVTDDVNTLESTHEVIEDFSVDDLGEGVTHFLNIQDDKKDNSASKKSDFQEKDVRRESCQSKIITGAPEKRLSNNDEFVDSPGFHSISMPTQSKPVSAMKGSREKRGAAPPTKLTVKWAPDVYDPVPTSVSHIVTNNRSSRHSKKNSKHKQKNASKSSSRGSKGKDKKQPRKRGTTSSSTGYKLHEHEDEPEPSVIDFHVGNPDQFCGSSFLKRYGTGLHLSSVAEAT